MKLKNLEVINDALENERPYEPTKEELEKRNEQKGLEPMSFSDFTNEDWQIEKPIVQYIVGENQLSIMGGSSGIGKSWWALNLAMSIASGKPFMDYFKTEKRKVLYAQFELTNGQLKERIEILKSKYSDLDALENLTIIPKGDSFTDQWEIIDTLLSFNAYQDGVLIVDNLYTSVDADTDLSNNPDIVPVIKKIDKIMKEHKCAIVVITHHTKGRANQVIDMDDILGGANLTRFASNCFQMKNSQLSPDTRVGKITKTRSEDCQIYEIPIKYHFDRGYFTKGKIIDKEIVHYTEPKDRWEIQLLNEMKAYGQQFNNDEDWDREYLWLYLEDKGWEKNPSNDRKVSRFINRVIDYGLIEKVGHNKYRILEEDS
jgi:RecA-family ATPase